MPTLNIGGQRVKVGDDFTRLSPEQQNSTVDEIAKSLAPKAPEAPVAAPAAEAPADQSWSGSILPVSKDAAGNAQFDSNAGLVGAVKRAFMLPGDAMAGKVDPTSEEGIGRAAEFAGVFSPATPAAGTGRAIAASTPRVERPGLEAAAAAERLGVDLPRAVASDSTTVQQGGKILSNVPLGGAPLRNASQKAIDQLGAAADNVAPGGNPANAGAAARTGITGHSKALGQRVSDAYANVDTLITQNVTTPLSNTSKVALEIGANRSNAALPESAAVSRIQEALKRPEGLNYQGIKQLRTDIGETLEDPARIVASGASQAELKRIYGALSDDLRDAVGRGGGKQASDAFESANQLATRSAREREALQKVLGRDVSDERLFDRITAMAGSNARADRVSLARVKGAVGDDTWNEIGSGVISRLGRDADGNFSPDRFISGYGKISSEGKQALFGKGEMSSSLDDIATVSRRFKQLNQYANPSGTGQTVLGGALGSGLIADPVTTIATAAGARAVSSLMARPVSAKALAAYSRAYEQYATRPSNATLRALENTSRAVSAFIANEAGDKALAAQVFPSISRVQQLPAEQGNENQGINERQDRRVEQQPRQLLPNEL